MLSVCVCMCDMPRPFCVLCVHPLEISHHQNEANKYGLISQLYIISSSIHNMLDSVIKAITSFLAAHPAIIEGIKLFLAGFLLETTRRFFTHIYHEIQRGKSPSPSPVYSSTLNTDTITYCTSSALTLTIRIKDNDDAFAWIENYLTLNSKTSSSTESSPSIYTILLETLWPKGRISARDIQVATRKQRLEYWFEETEGVVVDHGKKIKIDATPFYGMCLPTLDLELGKG
jgi:hypothetical protein